MRVASWAIAFQTDILTVPWPGRERQPDAPRRVAAVERAAAVLDALADGGELGTNELARRTGLNPSSVSRLLATLVDGRARRARRRDRPLPARAPPGRARKRRARPPRPARGRPAAPARSSRRPARRPPSRRPATRTRSPSTSSRASSVQSVARVGRPSVAHATATGKVALAFGDVALPPGRLQAFTERTIVDRAALAREVERVREQGWAQAIGEREDDLNAVAAPVRGSRGELAAVLGIQGPRPASARRRWRGRRAAARACSRGLRRFRLAPNGEGGSVSTDRDHPHGLRRRPAQARRRVHGVGGLELDDRLRRPGRRAPRRPAGRRRLGRVAAPQVGLLGARRARGRRPDLHERHARARDRPGPLRALLRREREDGRRRHGLQVHGLERLGDHGARLRPRPHARGRRRAERLHRADHREAPARPAPGPALARAARRASSTRTSRASATSASSRTRCTSAASPSGSPAPATPGSSATRSSRSPTTPRSSGASSPRPAPGPTASPPSRRSGSSRG